MNFNKKKCVRTQKEAFVKFVDDNDVHWIKTIAELKSETDLNEKRRKSLKEVDKDSSSIKKTKAGKKPENVEDTDNSGCDSCDEETVHTKPAALFQDGDVPGKAVFGFHTPKRKNAMAEKATESAEKRTSILPSAAASPSTPTSNKKDYGFTPRVRRSIALNLNIESVPETSDRSGKKGDEKQSTCASDRHKRLRPSEHGASEKTVPKTPYSLRAQLKSKIAAEVKRGFEDFSDSEEDFVPSELDESNSDSESSSESDIPLAVINILKREPLKTLVNTPTQKRKRRDLTYTITADEYFNSNSGKKNKTSNHTLNRLKNPKLAQDQLHKLLGDFNQNLTHQSSLEALRNESCMDELFSKWCFCLKEGFSILLFGLGSKRIILNAFHRKVLLQSHVLVVNGFFPGLAIKEIIDSLTYDLLNIKDVPSQLHEVIEAIEAKLSWPNSPRIFIIVHNLDGIMLRSDKVQASLARLASIPKCSLLASIDHINAPLLWNDKKLSDFNFIWEDVTTYNTYTEETSFENSLLIQRSGTLALASLKNVFQSLTKNGKEIFKILLEDSLANRKNKKYSGIGFSDLYWRCRDNFLVSTDLALRSQLTEFLDHQLIKWRKDSDHLIIPVDASVLEQFQNLLQEICL